MKFPFSRFFQGLTNSTLVLSLRQGFVALLPYLVLHMLVLLGLNIFYSFPGFELGQSLLYEFELLNQVIRTLLPLVVATSIAYYLSKNVGVNSIVSCTLVMICFLACSGYVRLHESGFSLDYRQTDASAILVSVLTVYAFSYFSRVQYLNVFDTGHVSVFLAKKINMILPFFISMLLVCLAMVGLSEFWGMLLGLLAGYADPLSAEASFYLWNLLSHTFWLFGMHGTHASSLLFGGDFESTMLASNLSVGEFSTLFVFLGGSGCVWGFVIASFFAKGNEHLRHIAKISVPFNFFNASEILMYCVPLILNPYFFVPFLLCPILNIFLAYFAIDQGLIVIVETNMMWTTPVVISGYFAGGGNLSTALFQLMLIMLNVVIYYPFVRQYSLDTKEGVLFDQFSSRFQVSNKYEGRSERRHLVEQDDRLRMNYKLRQAVDSIVTGEPLMYYQPKIDVHGSCYGFEALMRLKLADNKVVGPYFLTSLESAGFSNMVDCWAIDKVADDLLTWKRYGFEPHVSINMSPLVLTNNSILERVIERFRGYQGVEVEILETAYIEQYKMLRNSIQKLKESGVNTAIDDFGTGFSSLSLLYKLNAETIKLDKSILDNTKSEKGSVLYQRLCGLCKRLGFKLVAEGVETQEQADFVISAGVDYLQGWLYAPALPLHEAREYALQFDGRKRA